MKAHTKKFIGQYSFGEPRASRGKRGYPNLKEAFRPRPSE